MDSFKDSSNSLLTEEVDLEDYQLNQSNNALIGDQIIPKMGGRRSYTLR